MLSPQTFIGKPTRFKEIANIYPPSVNEVLGNPKFGQFQQTLIVSQEDIWDMVQGKTKEDGTPIEPPTPFEMLLINAHHSPDLRKTIMDAFKFFTHEEVRILPEQKIILFTANITDVKQTEDLRILQEDDYFDFQNIVRNVTGEESIEKPPVDEDPRITRMKAKARERDRIKKKQGVKNGISLTTSMAALCCMGIGVNPLNIGEISYASLTLLIKTYQEQERYRGEIQFLAGGADPKKLKPKYWIRNLND